MQFLTPEQGKRKTKFVSKSVFRFPNGWKTVGPLINLQSVQRLLFKMFFIIKKQKTEFDTDFRYFRARNTNGPLIHVFLIVVEFFSTVPGKDFDLCIISTRTKTHKPFRKIIHIE